MTIHLADPAMISAYLEIVNWWGWAFLTVEAFAMWTLIRHVWSER